MRRLLRPIKPFARSIKWGHLLRRAQKDAGGRDDSNLPNTCFILGCGRSGTTVLGRLIATHPEVYYLREPYYLWRAVDPQTDMIGFYGDAGGPPRCTFFVADATNEKTSRFRRCMAAEFRRGHQPEVLVEKTPINSWRIEYLNALAPDAKFVHIVRNGINVVRSISRLAVNNDYKIAWKGQWNQWWGRDNCKWQAMVRDARAQGWFESSLNDIQNDIERGALEWIVSLQEANRMRTALGDRMLEFRYEDFATSPKETLTKIAQHLGIQAPENWLDAAACEVSAPRTNSGTPMTLPTELGNAFNELQKQYGYEDRCLTR